MSLTWQHNYREHVLSTVDLTYRWKLCSALFMGLCRWTEAISHLVMLFLTSVGSWVGSSMFSTAQWCLHVFAQGIRGLPCQFNDKHVVEISLDGYLVFTWSAQWSTVNPGPWIKKPNGCLIGRVPFKYQIMTDYWRSIPPNYISTMVTINPGLTLRWNLTNAVPVRWFSLHFGFFLWGSMCKSKWCSSKSIYMKRIYIRWWTKNKYQPLSEIHIQSKKNIFLNILEWIKTD
jgi:hypothetical protein